MAVVAIAAAAVEDTVAAVAEAAITKAAEAEEDIIRAVAEAISRGTDIRRDHR